MSRLTRHSTGRAKSRPPVNSCVGRQSPIQSVAYLAWPVVEVLLAPMPHQIRVIKCRGRIVRDSHRQKRHSAKAAVELLRSCAGLANAPTMHSLIVKTQPSRPWVNSVLLHHSSVCRPTLWSTRPSLRSVALPPALCITNGRECATPILHVAIVPPSLSKYVVVVW